MLESNLPVTPGLQHIPTEPPAWAESAGRVIHYLINDFGGGRRCLKLAWVINFQKLATIPLLAIFIFGYQNFNVAAWVYAAMQSSYGLVWIVKDLPFPDPSFQRPATVGAGITSFLSVLGWYWVFGWLQSRINPLLRGLGFAATLRNCPSCEPIGRRHQPVIPDYRPNYD